MKNQSQRDLEKHWAEQAKKRTPAEQLRFKTEKLRKQIERSKAISNQNGENPSATAPQARKNTKSSDKPGMESEKK